jgi:hypothetical protein
VLELHRMKRTKLLNDRELFEAFSAILLRERLVIEQHPVLETTPIALTLWEIRLMAIGVGLLQVPRRRLNGKTDPLQDLLSS